MQFAQAKAMCVVDDHCVGSRDVDATFDDGGRNQNVSFAAHESSHDLLEFAIAHLSVTNHNSRSRRKSPHIIGCRLNVVHTIMHPENLSFSSQFAGNCTCESFLIPRNHFGHNRTPIRGRRCQTGNIAQSQHCHVKRARNGRRAECQHICSQTEFKESLLVLDTEALFFINDDKSKIVKSNIGRKQSVRSDHNINSASCDTVENVTNFTIGLESTDSFDHEGIRTQTFAKSSLVLFGENCRRN